LENKNLTGLLKKVIICTRCRPLHFTTELLTLCISESIDFFYPKEFVVAFFPHLSGTSCIFPADVILFVVLWGNLFIFYFFCWCKL